MTKYSEKDCDFCNKVDACDPCNENHCGCKYTFPAACVLYDGGDFCIIPATQGDSVESIFESLDAFLCELNENILLGIVIENVGGGAEVWKDKTLAGTYRFRTIVTGDDTLLDVEQEDDTVVITAGTHSLSLTDDILALIVSTIAGDTTLSEIDLSAYNYDTFVTGASFDSGTNILTITRNNSEPDLTVDLSDLLDNINVVSGAYASNTITLTLSDDSTVDIDLTTLVSEIVAAQIQSDYLETNPVSKAFIVNKNPEKTVTLGVAGNYDVVDADNNYIIEIDNGANDVTIDFSNITITSNYFVGFVQKGTGLVTFLGADIIPVDSTNELYGQGKNASVSIINSTIYLQGQLKFA